MSSRLSYALVGLFVIFLGGALVAGVLWLGAGGPRPAHLLYETYIPESVYGLSRDAAVTYRGVEVGRVLSIELDKQNPKRVHLVMEIREGTPVREDTVATLEVQALTGLAHVDLSGGSPDSPPLTAKPGQESPVIRSEPSVFGSLDTALQRLMDQISETVGRLNHLLGDQNQVKVAHTLSHMEAVSAGLAARTDDLSKVMTDLVATMDNARKSSAALPALAEQLQMSAKSIQTMADDIATSARNLSSAAVGTLHRVDRATVEITPDAVAMVSQLRQAAENLRRASEALARDPSIVVYGRRPGPPGPGE